MQGSPRTHASPASNSLALTPLPVLRGSGRRGRRATPGQITPCPEQAQPASGGAVAARPVPAKEAFVARFRGDMRQRAQTLANRASAPVVRLALHDVPAQVPDPHKHGIDLGGLLAVYEDAVPPACLKDQVRTLSTLERLVERRVQPEALRELIARGRSRDVWRAVASAELIYALSFGAAGAAGLSLVEQPLVDPAANGPTTGGLVQDLNATSAFMLTGGIIAAGGEAAQAIVREGKMGPRYNTAVFQSETTRTPFAKSSAGQVVQGLSAVPFGVLYAADHLVREWLPTPPAVRLAAGAGAAALSALFKFHAATRAGAHLDPTWLDASTPDKASAMDSALEDLQQGRWEASRGYCVNHLVPGLGAAAGQVLSEKGVVRIVGRLAAASLARAGAILTSATATGTNLYARLGSEAWLGLSWGTLSTWPQALLDGAARGHAQESAPSAATHASVKAVVPQPYAPAR